jgi:hypothetical protein
MPARSRGYREPDFENSLFHGQSQDSVQAEARLARSRHCVKPAKDREKADRHEIHEANAKGAEFKEISANQA